jgi:hypothetical protein
MMKRVMVGVSALFLLASVAGCSNMNQTEQRVGSGAAIGAATGAAVGVMTGGLGIGTGALIGAGVGATAGYIIDQTADD